MIRFAILVCAGAGLAGCVADPSGPIAAAVPAPSGDRAQIALHPGEPVTRTVSAPAAAAKPARPALAQAPIAPAPADERTVIAAAVVQPEVMSAPTTAPAPQAYAAASPQDSPALTRVAFAPVSTTRFDTARGGYGYALPAPRPAPQAAPKSAPEEDESQLITPEGGARPTTRRSATPGQLYYAAYDNTIVSCFPQALREALNTIAEHYRKEVEVTSGLRHNGRRGSYHRKCMAADIRVPGVSPGELASYAKSIDGLNGVGTYRHNNVTHIDVRDYQMSWRY